MVDQTEDKKKEIFDKEHKDCEAVAKLGENPKDMECAICVSCPHVTKMPCCGDQSANSSTRFCFACIKTYCES